MTGYWVREVLGIRGAKLKSDTELASATAEVEAGLQKANSEAEEPEATMARISSSSLQNFN